MNFKSALNHKEVTASRERAVISELSEIPDQVSPRNIFKHFLQVPAGQF